MQAYCDAAQQNMSLYTDYADLDKIPVYATKGIIFKKTGWIEYGQAKREGWTIQGDLSNYLRNYTTDDNLNVTKYAYWKNYSQALEANINILKTGGKLYSCRAEDFSVEGSLNADYNMSSGSAIVATGESVASEVVNHSITPSGVYSKYSVDALTKELKLFKQKETILLKSILTILVLQMKKN